VLGASNARYSTKWYNTTTGLVTSSGTTTANASGQISLAINALATDVAVRVVPEAAPLPLTADWPQHQCDASKSGFQPGVRLNTSRHTNTNPIGYGAPQWAWNFPGGGATGGGTESGGRLSGQPVVAEGTIAIGSILGTVYALNESNGQLRWAVDAGAPVLSSVAIFGGRVIVATQGGRVLALNKDTGVQAWVYNGATKGYVAAPTISDGRIYIGSKDGTFHCIDANSGAAIWKFDVGGGSDAGVQRAAIYCSAAVKDGRVYFGADNMCAYAISAASGAKIWRRLVRGQSFIGGWAVASSQAGGTVVFRTQPIYSFHEGLNSDEAAIQAATGRTYDGDPRGTLTDWITEQKAISARLAANPHRRSFWELDSATGTDRFSQPLPILYTSGSGDTPAPPVVADSMNKAWMMARSVYAIYDGVGVRQYGEFAKLNFGFNPQVYTSATLGLGALGMQFFAHSKTAHEDFHKISDEQEVLTACQNAVLASTWVSDGGIDIESERTFNIQFYSPDDTGGAPLYGSGCGIVIANNAVILRDTNGLKRFLIP
jgi:outer membrane protein assembly factor BamB